MDICELVSNEICCESKANAAIMKYGITIVRYEVAIKWKQSYD